MNCETTLEGLIKTTTLKVFFLKKYENTQKQYITNCT